MAEPKTRPTDRDVTEFLDAVAHPRRRAEGHVLRELMERVTQQPAVMWGPTMVGFGSTSHTNTLGTNNWFDVGFSPRTPALTIYGIHNAYEPDNPLLAELGPHTTGKSCVYVKRLDAIDLEVLERLVGDAWRALHG
ncbi:DUF1801 domain-containing protein [Pengzhenrongella sicca]|uniref:DUF1801 domain-containing protein n=1 Tax=Pengzhenrongella sicca TaxID=2819238 RepID=A0A8A4ZBW8_9MICO|nr:DUF1801 domain-containing protein [Pengzhenrongella sicca]QTE27997.1 DUF1801 domain-containing protein [Pengzhenrongella sicca]